MILPDPDNTFQSAEDNNTTHQPEQPFDIYFKEYLEYSELTSQLQRLAKEYPELMLLEDLTAATDNGATWQGNVVWGVKISDNVEMDEPDEPKTVIIGNVHAREWMAFEAPMYFIFHLLENYGLPPTDNDLDGSVNEDIFNGMDDDGDGLVDEDWSEGRVTWLVNNREIWVVPTVNPDGTIIDFEMQARGSGSWRKNARDNNENGVFETEIDGVDLNRNFAYKWDSNQQGIISENGIEYRLDSSNPTSSVYRGPQDNFDDDGDAFIPFSDFWDPRYRQDRNGIDEDPWDGLDNDGDGEVDEDKDGGFSEPETQALNLLMNRLDSDGNLHNMHSDVGISLAYHSVGGWVIWPWGYTYDPTPHEALVLGVGHELMDQTGYASWEADDMYMVSGDSGDWLYGTHGALAYTIELNDEPGAGFHPPKELIINTSRKVLTCNLYAAEMTGIARVAKDLNYPSLDIDLPVLSHDPPATTISTSNSYKVVVEVENHENLDLTSLKLHYRSGMSGSFKTILMITNDEDTNNDKMVFVGNIPSMPDQKGNTIYYYITGDDVRGLVVNSPQYGEGDPFSYKIESDKSSLLFNATVVVIAILILLVIVAKFSKRGRRGPKVIKRKIRRN
jgi:hypothetical protein